MLGVSTRRVDDLVRTLGIAWISKERGEPDLRRRSTPRSRPSGAARSRARRIPYLWLDATYLKVREGGRVVSMAALVATGVARTGERRILGLELAPGNDEGSGLAGLRPLARRARPPRRPPGHQRRPRRAWSRPSGSSSSDRAGNAAGSTSPATPRTSCPGSARSMVASRDPGRVRAARRGARPATQCSRVIAMFEPRMPAVARLLADAEPDLLAHFTFPELPPGADPLDQPAGAAQQGDQAPDGGRRDLPQPGRGHPPRRA